MIRSRLAESRLAFWTNLRKWRYEVGVKDALGVLRRENKEKKMLELIEWIRNGELIRKLASPYFWLAMAAAAIAAEYCVEAWHAHMANIKDEQ